jgi:outer membrane protein assembly factor BamB
MVLALASASLVVGPATAGAAAGAKTSAPQVNWYTVALNLQRTGDNLDEHVLSSGNVGRLKQLWVSGTDQWLEPSPVLATGVQVGKARETLIIDGGAHGLFFAFNAANGKIVWERRLNWRNGLGPDHDCDITPWGITSSPVIDPATGRVYVVDGDDKLYAFHLATGFLIKGWPVSLSHISQYEHVWSGLTELNGTIYVPVASDCDQGPYHGRLLAVSTVTAKVTATFYVDSPSGPDAHTGGGIWGWGGASVDTTGSHLYVASGNATPDSESNAGYASSVIELDAGTLKLVAAQNPGIGLGDNDFSGTPVLYHANGCPAQLAVESKTGYLYVYNQGQIAQGPVFSEQLSAPHVFIGDPAWSSANQRLYVGIPQQTSDALSTSLESLRPTKLGASCGLARVWNKILPGTRSVMSAPTVANGVVYVGDGTNDVLYALNVETGSTLWHHRFLGPMFAEPIVVNGRLYATDWDGDLFAFGI